MVDAGAILLTVLLAFLEIRHFINGGDVYRDSSSLAEIGLQVCVGLAMEMRQPQVRMTAGVRQDSRRQSMEDRGRTLPVSGLLSCCTAPPRVLRRPPLVPGFRSS